MSPRIPQWPLALGVAHVQTRLRGALFLPLLVLLASACSSTTPRQNPTGELFPAVSGKALDGASVRLPGDLAGEPSILLVGYEMDAQFDIDRWILGLIQLETPVRIFELPTIRGMFPGMFAGSIDKGMRGGIPSEDWGIVITLYGDDAARVVELTGNEGGRNARVLLLDGEGRIGWFTDRGYSANQLSALDARARELQGTPGIRSASTPVPAADSAPRGSAMNDDIELLCDFSDPETADEWQSIDDRVMGGVSRSRLRATDDGTAIFAGELSLEQGGGFASVRSAPRPLDLTSRRGVILKVRGDGRTYKLRLRTDAAFDGVSYQMDLATTAGVWTTIRLPFELFRPGFRGREVPEAGPLDTSAIKTIGLLVADEQAGDFELEIGWIGAYGSD